MSSVTRHCKFFVSMYAIFHVELMYVTSDIATLLCSKRYESKENVMKLNIAKSRDFRVYNLSFHLIRYLFFFFIRLQICISCLDRIDFHRKVIT